VTFALDGQIELVTSPVLLQEILMVLVRPRLQWYVSAEEAMRLVAELAGHPLVVDPGPP
jgi:predicted nucleic acid-binding protein